MPSDSFANRLTCSAKPLVNLLCLHQPAPFPAN